VTVAPDSDTTFVPVVSDTVFAPDPTVTAPDSPILDVPPLAGPHFLISSLDRPADGVLK